MSECFKKNCILLQNRFAFNCYLILFFDTEVKQHQPYKPVRASPQMSLKMPEDMRRFIFGQDSHKYLREVGLIGCQDFKNSYCIVG